MTDDEVLCGACGLPKSFPDLEKCGQEHGDLTEDDTRLVDSVEAADMIDRSTHLIHVLTTQDRWIKPVKITKFRGGTKKWYRAIDVMVWDFRRRQSESRGRITRWDDRRRDED